VTSDKSKHSLRIVDSAGNRLDVKVDFVPRIGELIWQEYGRGSESVKHHFLRVSGVMHHFDSNGSHQVAIRVEEEGTTDSWPT
jgi:hypothetical protein